jgi:hypothetical protein
MTRRQDDASTVRGGNLLSTARAVAWSFLGIRRRADFEHDVQRLNPVHLIVAGLAGAALFVGALVLLIRWIVASGVAS